MCVDCSNTCFSVVTDTCVEHTGTGTSLATVLTGILSRLDSIEASVTALQASQSGEFSGATIKTNAGLYGLTSSVNSCAANITMRNFSWSLVADSGYQFTYDLRDVVNGIPSEYSLYNLTVKAYGNVTGSSTLIMNTSKQAGGVLISADKLPVNVDFSVQISTPCGVVELIKQISITGSPQVGTWSALLEVKDLSSTTSSDLTVDEFNELLASQLSEVRTQVENLKTLPVTSSNVSYPSSTTEAVVQTHAMEISSLKTKVASESEITVDGTTDTVTNQVQNLSTDLTTANSKLDIQSESIETIKAAVRKLGGSV